MANKEQRKVNRKGLVLRASVMCVSNSKNAESLPVRTINLSTKGALIEASEEVFVNDLCTLSLVTNDARNVPVQGRIIWVKTYEDSTYRAGVAFRNLSPDAEYLISLQLVRS